MNKKVINGILSLSLSCIISVGIGICAYASNDAGFTGSYSKGNPLTSAPWGKAKTTADYDTDSISAKITVWNDGKYTDHDVDNRTWDDIAQTSKVYGANYASKGTRFEAYYSGTDADSNPTFWEDCDDWSY